MCTFAACLKGGVHGSALVHESKYFFPFARYGPSLLNLIRCLGTIRKGKGNSGGNFSYDCVISHANNCKYIICGKIFPVNTKVNIDNMGTIH